MKRLLSNDHFSVDGTLIEAWASIKSFRSKDGSDDDPQGPGRNAERNFHREKRSNETHQSTTDPDAKLYRKGGGQPPDQFSVRQDQKIDKSFIQGLPKRECAAVIASAVALARGLGITITAEGIETRISRVSELEFHGHRLWAGVSLQSPRTA